MNAYGCSEWKKKQHEREKKYLKPLEKKNNHIHSRDTIMIVVRNVVEERS